MSQNAEFETTSKHICSLVSVPYSKAVDFICFSHNDIQNKTLIECPTTSYAVRMSTIFSFFFLLPLLLIFILCLFEFISLFLPYWPPFRYNKIILQETKNDWETLEDCGKKFFRCPSVYLFAFPQKRLLQSSLEFRIALKAVIVPRLILTLW